MKFNFPFNNFSSGEWSPKMRSRSDTQEYMRSCEELTNMIVQMQGGVQYRGGTTRQDLLTQSAQTNLDTIFNLGATFKIIPYNPYNAQLATILCIKPDGTWVTLPAGQTVVIGANTSITNWNPAYTQYVQLGDLLILTNGLGTHKPKVFAWNTTTFQYEIKDLDRDYVTSKPHTTIPFDRLEALSSNVTMTITSALSAIGNTSVVTSSAAYFAATDVGRYIRFGGGTTTDVYARITSFTNTTTVNIIVVYIIGSSGALGVYGATAGPTTFWQISAWGDGPVGWPRTVTAFQGRAIFGGNTKFPDTIWGSRISNYFFFQEIPEVNTTGVAGFASAAYTADNARAFTLTPNTPEASNVVALSAGKTLNIHTQKTEIVAYGSNGALGPVNVVFASSTSFGALAVQPARVNNYSTFVQRNGYKVRDIIYSFDEDQYKSTDLGFVAEHMFLTQDALGGTDTIQEIARYEDRSSLLFARTVLGKLYVVTLDRDYQINAWSRITLGGSNQNPALPGYYPRILSMCNFPYAEGTQAMYFLVARYINGAYRVCLEYMNAPWELSNPANAAFDIGTDPQYLDCGQGCAPVDPVDGKAIVWNTKLLDESFYINAQNVSVVADGNYIGEFNVDAAGLMTLDKRYSSIFIGFKYRGVIKTSLLEQGGQYGQPVGRIKRIDEMVIRFHRSVGCLVGFDESSLEDIPMRDIDQPMNQAVSYFSGDKVVNFPADYNRATQVWVVQDKPYPMYITSITPRGQTYEG